MYFCNATAQRRVRFHLRHIVQQEQELPVTGAREHGKLFAAFKVGVESGVENLLFAAHLIGVCFPALAVWRIGEHEIKLPGGVSVQ